jgi:hypothetical protein
MRSRWRAAAGTVAVAALAGIALAVGVRGFGRVADGPPARVSRPAPQFIRPLASLKGGTFSLSGQRGHPVLLSFLNTQAEAATGNDASRAEIVFIKSMNTQTTRTACARSSSTRPMPPGYLLPAGTR